jgi:hypothetical protein
VSRAILALTLSAITIAAVGACSGQPDLVLVNRSDRDIAFWLGVVVSACDSLAVTAEQVEAAKTELDRWFREADDPVGWVPPDAVTPQVQLAFPVIGTPDRVTMVISGQHPPQVYEGLPRPDVPACGGEPVWFE